MVDVAPNLAPARARSQLVVLSVLLMLAAAAWALFLSEAGNDVTSMGATGMEPGMAMESDEAAVDLSMGRSPLPFLASWVAMMAAMMLPAAAPMILLYARTQTGRPLNTALFAGSYLLLWAALGLVGFLVAVAIEEAVDSWSAARRHWGRTTGISIVAAGLYQLSPLKDVCLRQCRSPLSFLFMSWRGGPTGAVHMGLRHGLYCVGCCWALFLVLIPVGVMNVAAMVLVALVVFSEKVLPRPELTRHVVAVLLVAYGAAVVARPALLPSLG